MKNGYKWLVWAAGLFAATSLPGETDEEALFELEAFIVEESAQTQTETLSPLSAEVDSLLGESLSPEAIPRGLSILPPELLATLQIESYEDLDKFGAGTQRINYFGLAGSAFIRGARAGTYFNGMLRAYQRNEMPMSFGSLESLEIIKGPVPAGFSPTLVGGAVNQIPKSPFFNREHGLFQVRIGSWDERHVELDYGAPLLLFGNKPAAYRISYTGHRADRFYENVPNDYDSLYASAKIKLSERHRLFVGGEYYNFRSSEIPGINRPTPELVANRRYVIGEPPRLTSPEWDGTVARPLLQFPQSLTVNPALFSLSVPGKRARAEIPQALRAQMLDLNDPAVVANLYSVLPANEVPPFAAEARVEAAAILDGLPKETTDAYVYTPAYFAAGGEALTETLAREKVLADPEDKADAWDAIAFADLESRLANGSRLRTRLFAERMSTEKRSTYGFAFDSDQTVLNGRVEWLGNFPGADDPLTVGADLRFSRAETLQDFDAEPFSRRDLSRESISTNSVVRSGDYVGPDGLNYWSSFGNASQKSDLWQAAMYGGGHYNIGEAWKIHYGLRLEQAWWEVGLPGEVDRASESRRAARKESGRSELYQLHLNPTFEVLPGVFLYGALQLGKVLAPGDGGDISGEKNFPDAELFETGIKANLLDGKFYTALSVYHWDQASFSSLDAQARPLRAKGIEWETTAEVTPRLTLLAAFTAQRVHLRGDMLGFGALPQDEEGWALNAGVLNAAGGRSVPNNPDMIFAGMPELSGHLYAVFEVTEKWQVSGGPLWRDRYAHDMGRTIWIPESTVWSVQSRYDGGSWWLRLHVENLFDEEYWLGQDPVFSAGTLILQAPGRRVSVTAGLRF